MTEQNPKSKVAHFKLEIPLELRAKFKAVASLRGITMKKLIIEAMTNEINRESELHNLESTRN